MGAVGEVTVGTVLVYVASVTVALGVLYRYFVRPAWRAWRKAKQFAEKANEIVTRELTHNGGESLKDVVHSMDEKLNALASDVHAARTAVGDNFRAVEAVAHVMDGLVDRKEEDHERIWQQIVALGGIDPRRKPAG